MVVHSITYHLLYMTLFLDFSLLGLYVLKTGALCNLVFTIYFFSKVTLDDCLCIQISKWQSIALNRKGWLSPLCDGFRLFLSIAIDGSIAYNCSSVGTPL